MSALHFDESLVTIIEDEGLDTFAVEDRLVKIMHGGGWIKDSFGSALCEREQNYPTALDAGGINVAIPHCDPGHVNHGAICAAVLKHPVAWRRMDDPAQTCDVSLVVMLALEEAHAHMDMLQKVIGIVQDQALAARVVASRDSAQLYGLLKDYLA